MRNVISGLGQLVGILIAIAGLIVCMCETADLDKQLVTLLTGLAMFLIGAGITTLAKGVEENEKV